MYSCTYYPLPVVSVLSRSSTAVLSTGLLYSISVELPYIENCTYTIYSINGRLYGSPIDRSCVRFAVPSCLVPTNAAIHRGDTPLPFITTQGGKFDSHSLLREHMSYSPISRARGRDGRAWGGGLKQCAQRWGQDRTSGGSAYVCQRPRSPSSQHDSGSMAEALFLKKFPRLL
jgi:hypothetical protein